MYTCNCCGSSCKKPNISVKIQLNLHQHEPFQVKKFQNFLGRGHSPSPEPSPVSSRNRRRSPPPLRPRTAISHQASSPGPLRFHAAAAADRLAVLLPLPPVSSPQRHELTPLKPARGSGKALYSPELQRGSEHWSRAMAAVALCCIVCSQDALFATFLVLWSAVQ